MEKEGKLAGHDVSSNNYNKNSSDQEELINDHEQQLKRGPWTVEEDFTLINYIAHHGEGRWNSLARCAGLKRTGKSCRLRWLNYLRPDVRRGNITLEEQLLILELHSRWGNRWSKIAQHLPGRTDNEIKNYWRTRVQKHAKHLKCDVNSNQFKDTMRYLWMPRLVERSIQAAPTPADHSGGVITYAPSAAASSDSFGTPVSDLTESCYNNNNNPINNKVQQQQQQGNINQDYYNTPAPANYYDQLITCGDHQSLTSPTTTGYFDQGTTSLDFMEQNFCTSSSTQRMDGGDHVSTDSLWNLDDMWF